MPETTSTMHKHDVVIVLTTAPDLARAEQWARLLVDERLAACVNVHGPMVSFYRWKGAVERDEERQLVIKTTAGSVAVLQARLAGVHPYEVPEFLVLPVLSGSDGYLDWVESSTGQA